MLLTECLEERPACKESCTGLMLEFLRVLSATAFRVIYGKNWPVKQKLKEWWWWWW